MNKKIRVFATAGIVVALLLVLYLVSNGITKLTGYAASGDNSDAENLAKYLTEKNITMYGSKYCPHCSKQKLIFGEAFKYINYVECSESPDLCKGLEGVPAWKINGEIYYGTKTLDELKRLSGY